MRVWVTDAHAHVQRLVSVVKMATVIEGCANEEQRSVVRLGGGGGRLDGKDIQKEMFLVYGGKCL
jgi:hypothetical protein